MGNSIQSILDPLNIAKPLKAQAWDAYYSAKTPDEFKRQFDRISIPKQAKAALWDSKFGQKTSSKTATQSIPEEPAIGREAALGFASGISGLPESKTPFTDAVKGIAESQRNRPLWEVALDPANISGTVGALGKTLYGVYKEVAPVLGKLTPGGGSGSTITKDEAEAAAHGVGKAIGQGVQLLIGRESEEIEPESSVGHAFRKTVQGAAGAGRARVGQIMAEQAAEADKAALEYHQATEASEYAGQIGDVEARNEWQAKKAKAEADYQQKVLEAKQEWEKKTADVKAKNLEAEIEARADYIEKLHEFDKATRDYGRRQALNRGKQDLAEVIKKNVDETRSIFEDNQNHRWDMMRSGLGEKTPIDSAKVIDTIQQAKREYLRGSPADLAEFDRILSEMGLPQAERQFSEAMQMSSEEMARRFPPDFMKLIGRQAGMDVGDALVHRSALGRKLMTAPGNVKQALGMVQDALDDSIGTVAKQKGMGGEFQKLLKDYRQYKQDWINTIPSPRRGGSSLAQMASTPSNTPLYAQDVLDGKGFSDFMQRFSRYKDFGARPEAGDAYARVQLEYKSIPNVKRPPEKPEYVAPKRQALPEEPQIERPEIPSEPGQVPREVPSRREVIQKTPKQIREKLLGDWADRPFRWWEYTLISTGPTPMAIEPWLKVALRSPRFRSWIASQPRVGAEIQ